MKNWVGIPLKMFPKCSPDVPRKKRKVGEHRLKKAANPLRINDFHFGRLRRERTAQERKKKGSNKNV